MTGIVSYDWHLSDLSIDHVSDFPFKIQNRSFDYHSERMRRNICMANSSMPSISLDMKMICGNTASTDWRFDYLPKSWYLCTFGIFGQSASLWILLLSILEKTNSHLRVHNRRKFFVKINNICPDHYKKVKTFSAWTLTTTSSRSTAKMTMRMRKRRTWTSTWRMRRKRVSGLIIKWPYK